MTPRHDVHPRACWDHQPGSKESRRERVIKNTTQGRSSFGALCNYISVHMLSQGIGWRIILIQRSPSPGEITANTCSSVLSLLGFRRWGCLGRVWVHCPPFPPFQCCCHLVCRTRRSGVGKKSGPPMSPPTLKWGERGIPPLRICVSNARTTNERMLANTNDSKLHP